MIRVALVDGALPEDWPGLERQQRFCDADGERFAVDHAIAMARTIQHYSGPVSLVNAVVFQGRLATSVGTVCDALDWLAEDPPDLILCAFGMNQTTAELAVAVSRLQRDGTVFVASAPSRGEAVYPAGLFGVMSVQGDTRCRPGELSRLDLPHAKYGASPKAIGDEALRGASPAAAHLSGLLAAEMPEARGPISARLENHVRYRGRERKVPARSG